MSATIPQPKSSPGQKQQQIQIKYSDEVLKGAYATMALVSHSAEEFTLDFMNVSPAQGKAIVNSRVIISPQHMKRLAAALQENLKRYEAQFGKIAETSAPEQNFGFRTE